MFQRLMGVNQTKIEEQGRRRPETTTVTMVVEASTILQICRGKDGDEAGLAIDGCAGSEGEAISSGGGSDEQRS